MTDLDPQELIAELQAIAPHLATKLTHERLGFIQQLTKQFAEGRRAGLREVRERVIKALVIWKHHHALPMNHLSPETVMLEAIEEGDDGPS